MYETSGSGLYASLLASLEKEANSLLEAFLQRLESAPHPSSVEEKISRLEGKCEMLALPAKQDEFALNEVLVVAQRLEEELDEASALLPDARLQERQEEWADCFEQVKSGIIALRQQAKVKMGAQNARLFRARAKECRLAIKKLSSMIYGRAQGKMHKRVAKIRQQVRVLKNSAHEAASAAAKRKLALQIGERMGHLYSLLAKSGHGRLIIDSKHMTVKSANGFVHDAVGIDELTHHALEGMLANTPLGARLKKLAGSNSMIAATFEAIPTPEGIKIKVVAGERVITGDAIVYRPHTFYLSARS
ncbi:hypothetical protein J4441_04325 [Candidatus Micrarchaeota archaeon]|nr:hypothetical protein [Candidatus Micrarchaeota archaeon]